MFYKDPQKGFRSSTLTEKGHKKTGQRT